MRWGDDSSKCICLSTTHPRQDYCPVLSVVQSLKPIVSSNLIWSSLCKVGGGYILFLFLHLSWKWSPNDLLIIIFKWHFSVLRLLDNFVTFIAIDLSSFQERSPVLYAFPVLYHLMLLSLTLPFSFLVLPLKAGVLLDLVLILFLFFNYLLSPGTLIYSYSVNYSDDPQTGESAGCYWSI